MKICIFSANFLPNIGGIERYTYYLSKELIKKGHSVTVVTCNVLNVAEYENMEGIEVYRMPCYNFLNNRYPICKNNTAFHKIDEKLNNAGFDFVIINARFYIHSLYAARFAHKNNIPCITIEHGSSHLSVNNKVLDYFGGLWEHFVTAILKRYCDDYYGVSQAACEWSAHFGIRSKGVLYNAIDLEEIEKMLVKPVVDYRREYKIPQDGVVVVFTGRLIPEKGVHQLEAAINRLQNEKVYLFFAGDGPEKEKLLKQANSNTVLLGKLDFSQIAALLAAADIFCLPSVSEGMSTSVLEAAATKTFVITTATGGSKELISGDEYGIITQGNSEDEMYEALKKTIENSQERLACAERTYERVKKYFTFEKTAEKLEEIILAKQN